MKLTDHESDTLAAARLGTPPPAMHVPAYRESWLDKIARHLGAMPVDQMPIIPPDGARPACCNTADCG